MADVFQVVDNNGTEFDIKDATARNLIEEIQKAINPTGAILAFGGSSAPNGWLLCNGAAVSRSTYSELFAVIGTAFGAGDGSTTFNVPNLTGKTPTGAETNHALGASENGALPNITGGFLMSNQRQLGFSLRNEIVNGVFTTLNSAQDIAGFATNYTARGNGGIKMDASLASSVYKSGETKVTPANVRVNYIIKA